MLKQLSLQTLLENSLGDEELENTLVEFLSTQGRSVLNRSIAKGTYQLFLRTQDPQTINGDKNCKIWFITTFASEEATVEWIIRNGKQYIGNVLDSAPNLIYTIIYCQLSHSFVEHPAILFGIAKKRYPSYAFTEAGYTMLLKEYKRSELGLVIPYWIHYIKFDKEMITACDFEFFKTLYCGTYELESLSAYYEKYKQDPNEYIKRLNEKF